VPPRDAARLAGGTRPGTSMASPHVAGVAGLLRDAEPKLSPRQVVARLLKTADDIGPRLTFGHGMVDADGAIP
jgi:subtilisin family serine protease